MSSLSSMLLSPQHIVACALLPPCFGAPSHFGGYKPREEYWDLDFEGRKPVLFSIKTPFSAVQAYYIPPLNAAETKTMVIAYPGNTRAVGSLMRDFWSLFGNDVHLILVNPCGYGNFDEDRSSPMDEEDGNLLEAWLRAIPFTIERELLRPLSLDWGRFNPRSVTKDGVHMTMKQFPVNDLPASFSHMTIVAFGRSIGAFLASCHIGRPKIYYTPFQSVAKIRPSGILGVLWSLMGQFAPFPDHENQTSLALHNTLTDDQRNFIETYGRPVFTGLESDLDAMLSDKTPCLLAVATEDNVVGSLDEIFRKGVEQADNISLVSMEGKHNVLPDSGYKEALIGFLATLEKIDTE